MTRPQPRKGGRNYGFARKPLQPKEGTKIVKISYASVSQGAGTAEIRIPLAPWDDVNDDLTIGQAKELASMFGGNAATPTEFRKPMTKG